jgi:hypothetical protein
LDPALHVQSVSRELPAGASECVGQASQVDAAAAPCTAEYLPVGQLRHADGVAALGVAEYVPASQLVQAADPRVSAYFPAAHGLQDPPSGPECPVLQEQSVRAALFEGESEWAGHPSHVLRSLAEYFPASHSEQSDFAVAPIVLELVPASHSTHDPAPTIDLNFPATHAVQVPPSGPEKPQLHLHSDRCSLPAGDCEFSGHDSQASADDDKYLLAGQLSTMQALSAELPSGELEFAGHSWHVDSAVAPLADEYFPCSHTEHAASASAPIESEYLPGPQALQSSLPVTALYLPAAHFAQGPPSGPVLPVLQAQAMMEELPAGEFASAGQDAHTELDVAPTA